MATLFQPDWRFAVHVVNEVTDDANLDDVLDFLDSSPEQPWGIVLPYSLTMLDASVARYLLGPWGESGYTITRQSIAPGITRYYLVGSVFFDNKYLEDPPVEASPAIQLRFIDDQLTEVAAIRGWESHSPEHFIPEWIKIWIVAFYNERLAVRNLRIGTGSVVQPILFELPENPSIETVMNYYDVIRQTGQRMTYDELAAKTGNRFTAGYLRKKASDRRRESNKQSQEVPKKNIIGSKMHE